MTMWRLGLVLYYGGRAVTLIQARFSGWTNACYLQANARACGSVKVAGPVRIANVSGLPIGNNVHINADAYCICEGGLSIGDKTIFACGVTIYTRNHNYSGTTLPFDDTNLMRPVIIGRNVWVGTNVTIPPRAHIHYGAIIGAGAVVAGVVVPAGPIFAAPKAQVLGKRDMAHYAQLDMIGAYHQPDCLPWCKKSTMSEL